MGILWTVRIWESKEIGETYMTVNIYTDLSVRASSRSCPLITSTLSLGWSNRLVGRLSLRHRNCDRLRSSNTVRVLSEIVRNLTSNWRKRTCWSTATQISPLGQRVGPYQSSPPHCPCDGATVWVGGGTSVTVTVIGPLYVRQWEYYQLVRIEKTDRSRNVHVRPPLRIFLHKDIQ